MAQTQTQPAAQSLTPFDCHVMSEVDKEARTQPPVQSLTPWLAWGAIAPYNPGRRLPALQGPFVGARTFTQSSHGRHTSVTMLPYADSVQ
jgi:hypothetical protein